MQTRLGRSRSGARQPGADLRDLAILVVDDEADTRELNALVLTAAGARVTTAGNALEARRVAASTSFDVVVSDVAMPVHSGHDLVRWLRQDHGPELIVIAVSGHTRDVDRQAALAAGFDAHLGKPLPPDDLLARIGELLAARSASAA